MMSSLALAVYLENPVFNLHDVFQRLLENVIFIILAVTIWFLSSSSLSLYESPRIKKLDWLSIFKNTTFNVAFIVVAAEVLNTHLNTPTFILYFWFATLLGMVLTRLLLARILVFLRLKDRNLRHIIIVGIGERGRSIAKLLKQHPEVGYRVIGYVDNLTYPNNFEEDDKLELLGGLESFAQIISEMSVDEIFICLPIKSSYMAIQKLVNQCKEQGIPARLSSDFFDLKEVKIKVESLGHAPIITLYNGMEESPGLSIKRFLDILISGVMLILLLPLFIVVALTIKLSDFGPVFFVQTRIGLHKRKFNLYKFRTMVVNAEQLQAALETQNEVSGPVFKISNDPRMTRIGRFLRRYSIDELPQLINVFKGEMSLVGPRPLPLRDVENFDEYWTRRRFSVRPGITCIWQTSGRSDISFEQWMELDLKYIDHWSLKMDFMILLKTIPAILKGTGAY